MVEKHEHFCDIEYIHFARQVDFIKIDNIQVISKIFSLDRLGNLERWLVNTYRVSPFSSIERNQSRQAKEWAHGIIPIASTVAGRVRRRACEGRCTPYG